MTTRLARVGVILGGGASRRMGVDKAFVEYAGIPMAVRVVDALRTGGCSDVECQGGDTERFAALGLDTHPDVESGWGPVPAIVQAVGRHSGVVVIAACDLPDLDGRTVDAVASAADRGAAAAVAVSDGPHLVVAIRSLDAGGPRLDAVDATSFRGLLAEIDAVEVAVAAAAVRNVNRPIDLG